MSKMRSFRPEIEALLAPANRLGECPIWCNRSRMLWWVDVLEPALWSFDPATNACRRHAVGARRIGSIALREQGGLVLACDSGLYAYDPDTGSRKFLVDPEPGIIGHRKNDGRADPWGNFWIGTLEEDRYRPVGKLYRVTPDLSVTVEAEALAIPNSLAFDKDRGRIYFADTRAYTIWTAPCALSGARAGQKSIFATTAAPARPDGSCVDAEGCLWNAEYEGSRVVRYAPSGAILATIELPVSHPTCCCFGGVMLDRLFVTSAIEPLDESQRADEPLAGRVLVLDPGVRGRPEYRVGL
ncbi:SMP-30/gluconolactonase/LRE family protein [Mesorhizobium koreense]|uniref:SMP-30/gluconolactonase/LRE family protein n=1 Tax=Mesorhizobium koreense TaxID=3074855 RepID=UPI00287BC8C9|nr:SMP-30/gluconolactonase/LRE family protein [Mesorhizobium sp. WR6]